jgi:hypothetical protein
VGNGELLKAGVRLLAHHVVGRSDRFEGGIE